MNRVDLPLNRQPFVRSNISRASLFSVLTSEEYAGELNAIISLQSLNLDKTNCMCDTYKDFEKKVYNTELFFDKENGALRISSNPYKENKYAYLFKKIDIMQNFCFEIKVDYIQDSNALSYVKLVLSSGFESTNKQSMDSFINEVSICITPKGKLIFSAYMLEKDIVLKNVEIKNGIFLRLELEEYLGVKYSIDGVHWSNIAKIPGSFLNAAEIGIYIKPQINPFFYDFFISHIQLCCTMDTMIIAPHFESYERFFSTSLQAMHIPMDMIDITDKEIIAYFIRLIEKNYYINMGLNEYFIPGRSSYHRKNYIHVNFIYGVDKVKKVFKIMGFDNVLKYDEIDFDDFFYAIQREIGPTSKINLYKYDSKGYPKQFDINMAIKMLKVYLNGENIIAVSSNKTIMIEKTQPIMFGISIIRNIIGEEKYMGGFIKDKRVIYQLHEHIEILIKMLEFLNVIDLLSDIVYENLLEKFNATNKMSQIILNIVLKNALMPVLDINIKLRELLGDLCKMEEDMIEDLIYALENSLDCNR